MSKKLTKDVADIFKRVFNEKYGDRESYREMAELTGKFPYTAFDYDEKTGRNFWGGIELPAHPKINGFSKNMFRMTVNDPHNPKTELFKAVGSFDAATNDAMIEYSWRGNPLFGKPDITYGENGEMTVSVADLDGSSLLEIKEMPNAQPAYAVKGQKVTDSQLNDALCAAFDM